MPPYAIEISRRASDELEQLRAFDRRPIVQAIRTLAHQAEIVTRSRKPLREPLGELPPGTWQLRVGRHRVLYEIRDFATVRVLREEGISMEVFAEVRLEAAAALRRAAA
jgi:mRNA-degrading endonuclease RelE of RelBE toxin-antitoxin system